MEFDLIVAVINALPALLAPVDIFDIWPAIADNVREQISDGDGVWRSCSGCYETEDGQNVHGDAACPAAMMTDDSLDPAPILGKLPE